MCAVFSLLSLFQKIFMCMLWVQEAKELQQQAQNTTHIIHWGSKYTQDLAWPSKEILICLGWSNDILPGWYTPFPSNAQWLSEKVFWQYISAILEGYLWVRLARNLLSLPPKCQNVAVNSSFLMKMHLLINWDIHLSQSYLILSICFKKYISNAY